MTRRALLGAAVAGAGLSALEATLPVRVWPAGGPPTAPVSIGKCTSYELADVTACLDVMVGQLGGLEPLVKGKTVAVKVNLNGDPSQTIAGRRAGRTFQVHPNVGASLAILLDRAGATRIRFLESTTSQGPVERVFAAAGWNLRGLARLKASVEFEDTRNLGLGKRYARVPVPWGGSLFPAYDLNHSYVDGDVYISLAKLKNHIQAGVTLSMKNNFGITPSALYGQGEQDEQSTRGRVAIFHEGKVRPAAGLPQEVDPTSPRGAYYRVPRLIVDAVGIRPIDFALIDGIETISGGEGPWADTIAPIQPGLLIAGRNAVCTDTIATVCMGCDPLAAGGTGPFPGDNHLALAAQLNLGSNDPRAIEVRGVPIADAIRPFGWVAPRD
jgi:uncharacterized protein (DUF362 family)